MAAGSCDSPVVVPARDRVSPTAESTEELPPGAEDDRQARPAEHLQHQQGGLAQSKLAPAERGCCSIGNSDEEQETSDDHNRQVIKLIEMLGQTGDGRRAVVKALAAKQGIEGDDELEELYSGRSEQKLVVPRGMRDTLRSIGLDAILAPVNLITAVEPQHILVNETWQDIEFEVALDSGSVVHVCSVDDCPGYRLGESAGSRRGQEFLMGDGGTIPNMGQSKLNLSDGTKDIESIFQIAAVTRPLMSVAKICDEGHTVTFDSVMAVVHSADGDELCKFKRKDGGLYVACLKLRNPTVFGRQE